MSRKLTRKERLWVLAVTLFLIGFPILMASIFTGACQDRGGELYNGACLVPGLRR